MKESISRERFIRLGALLGVSAASASALAACGGGSSGGSGGDSGSGYGGGSGGGSEANAGGGGQKNGDQGKQQPEGDAANKGVAKGSSIARTSEVAAGSAVKFKDGGQPAVLVHLDSGDFVAYSAVCTHAGCTVGYSNKQLACPCHGSVFDPANGGEVVSPPADQPLQEIPVEVRGGEVFRA